MSKEIYNPLWLNEKLELPKDRLSINTWCRYFYNTTPLVQQTIDFYSVYAAKFLEIKYCEDEKVNNFFKNQIDKIYLFNIIEEVIKSYLILGECFIYGELDELNARWENLIIQNPDYVIVKSSSVYEQPNIFLRPDEKLRSLVLNKNPSEQDLKTLNSIGKDIINNIKNGENIPLDNFYVSHICRKMYPYDIRGTGILIPVLKDLIMLQKLADKSIFDDEQKSLELRIKEAIGHPSVLVGSDNNLVRVDVARIRIMQMADMIVNWVEHKLFAPIAKINSFIDAEKNLIMPRLVFDSDNFYKALKNDLKIQQEIAL